MLLFPVTLIFEFIAFFASIFFFLRKRNKLIGYFLAFLFITVCVEVVAVVWSLPAYKNSTLKLRMYNVFFIFEFVFYSFIFYLHFKHKQFRKMVVLFMVGIVLFGLANILFFQGFGKTINSYTSLLGSFFIVLFCCFFFYKSIQPDQIDNQLSKQPFFWISSGLLIFYLGSVIINALWEYLSSNALENQGQKIFQIINHFLNVVLYSSFCIAFYLCPDRRKTYSSPSL